MQLSLFILGMLATSAYADCDACVAGFCYSRRTLIQGFRITDQLAIDRTNNVLYTQINSNLNTAFFLDECRTQLVHMMNTSGMAVDPDKQILYMGMNEMTYYEYTYNHTSNIMETQYLNGPFTSHGYRDLIFYGGNKLYFVGKRNVSNIIRWKKTYLKEYFISDLVIDKENNYFFVSNNKVYMYNDAHKNPATVILQKDHVLSTNEDGAVYFGDASQKVIYRRDTTGDLNVYAVYKTGSLEDFVFDRHNNVVFRDGDGSIAAWVPSYTARCVVDPPHDGFSIREVENQINGYVFHRPDQAHNYDDFNKWSH